jgi:hypothetical protein
MSFTMPKETEKNSKISHLHCALEFLEEIKEVI